MNKDRQLNINTVDKDELSQVFSDIMHAELGDDFKDRDQSLSLGEFASRQFLYYGASVVAGRALPSIFDGLKSSQRRLLYTMKDEIKLSSTGSFKKSARIVGATIGLYHPHGDNAMYETLVNVTQPFKKMLPLAKGQGNWGSMDGSNAAAPRYTESRLTDASMLMFKDLEFDTVHFIPNYDGTENEPEILPVPYPNILINGIPQGSIATGMASSILPHNPTEIMNAMIKMLEHRRDGQDMSVDEFVEIVPGPDFPTGGYIYGTDSMSNVVNNGKGRVRLRAKHHVEELSRGKSAIVIDEIPWGKTTETLIKSVVELKRKAEKDDKMAQAITRINDESDSKNPLRISIEIKSGYDPEVVWNYILNATDFDVSHSYFSVVLDIKENSFGKMAVSPEDYGLLTILNRYVDFREEYFLNKHKFLINKYSKRIHILEGLIRAIDLIDEIIDLIRTSEDQDDAKMKLIELEFSKEQADAIIAMRLGRLTKLPKGEFISERDNLNNLRQYSLNIVNDDEIMYDELIKESIEVKGKIHRPRQSEIRNELSGLNLEDIIPKEDCVIYVTKKGYVKRVSAKEIQRQNRGTQGKKGIQLTEDDFIEKIFHTNTHSILMFVMNNGQVYGTKAYNVPDSKRGAYIENIFDLASNEKIVNVVEVQDFEDYNLMMVTKDGTIKSTNISEYTGCLRKSGVIGIKLKDENEVISSRLVHVDSQDEMVIATKLGKAIRFEVSDISTTGRNSRGVRGIRLKDDNEVVGSAILKPGTTVATVTENGMVKLSSASEFKIQSRGGIGVSCMTLTKRSGSLIAIMSWNTGEEYDIVTITKNGVLNRINTSSIKTTSRATKGVKLIDLRDDDSLASVLKVETEEETTEDLD